MSFCDLQEKVTVELIQLLDEEERRWAQTLHIEEFQTHLARSVIQVHKHLSFTPKYLTDFFMIYYHTRNYRASL